MRMKAWLAAAAFLVLPIAVATPALASAPAHQSTVHPQSTRVTAPPPSGVDPQSTRVTASTSTCPRGALCIWRDPNFQGPRLVLVKCGVRTNIGWWRYGSWLNNQTGNAVGVFRANTYVLGRTGPPVSANGHFNWLPVTSVQPC